MFDARITTGWISSRSEPGRDKRGTSEIEIAPCSRQRGRRLAVHKKRPFYWRIGGGPTEERLPRHPRTLKHGSRVANELFPDS